MENNEGITVEAIGFDLVPSEMGHINRLINDLFQLCPIDSLINLKFSKEDEGFTGLIEVQSSIKSFAADGTGSDIQSLYRMLDQQIQDQLMVWKKDRFK
ncbi:hypothetical protein [Bacteriovorax sp. Seq25_V]|uniref:hypothetical protein n=1 Tax=Bacteriovorax sp. Seq25_V TaxID=1201288 RepID=UPI000389EE7E|nr:hypothetical protein [Bacteriovorax sp. Seq25_V]EQC45685.1 hypothetical protein M900_2278 [Bacteriovorax sp. Seq25_V]